MAVIAKNIQTEDGLMRGTRYILEKAGDKLQTHVHPTEADNHMTTVVAGAVRLDGHPDHEGVELDAERDQYPIIMWKAGQPHGITATRDNTIFDNWRKVPV